MGTLLFVHGTGVRWDGYTASLKLITDQARVFAPGWAVRGCYWGSSQGAKLSKDLLSVPRFLETGGAPMSEQDETIGLWAVLYTDPLYELRLLQLMPTVTPPFGESPADRLIRQVRSFTPSESLKNAFTATVLGPYLLPAIEKIAASPEFAKAAATAPAQPLEHRQALARAIVATAVLMGDQDDVPDLDGAHRDELVVKVASELQAYGLGVGTWLKNAAASLITRPVTWGLMANRGEVSESGSPFVGDILRFLAYPDEVNSLLTATLEDLSGEDVVILGHSLGGIMAVDLLARAHFPHVRGLITVGSQAPYFCEIGALPSIPADGTLPETVPRWLNIYDLHDMLSYLAAPVFPGRATDSQVDNGEPFPKAHSAYWNNRATWTAITDFLS